MISTTNATAVVITVVDHHSQNLPTHRIRMEDIYQNISNSSDIMNEVSLGPGFTVFIIVLSMLLIAIITIDTFMAITLLLSKSLAIPIRVLLVNLLVASLLSAVISLSAFFKTVILSFSSTAQPSLPFCRFLLWGFYVAVEARILGLVAFSVLVQRIVTRGTRRMGARWLILSLVATWAIATITRIDIIVPPIYGVQYVGGVACFPVRRNPKYEAIRLSYFFLWVAFACCVPLLVCICVFLYIMNYLKRHTISEGAQYKKAMSKFAAFLITGNIVNVLGQLVPAIVALTLSHIMGVYLAYTMYGLSLIPTPILIVVFLKPVRKHIQHLMCKKCLKDEDSGTVDEQINTQIGTP